MSKTAKPLAWSLMGHTISDVETASDALIKAKLNYNVLTAPMYIHPPNNNEPIEITTNKCIIRHDTFASLGVVGNRYQPVQNIESLNFIYDILKHNPDISNPNDIIIEKAGAMKGGSEIFVTVKLPKGFSITNHGNVDDHELYIVFTNSHNGTSSLRCMITPIRLVCNNMLRVASSKALSHVAFRHTASIHTQLKKATEFLGITYTKFNELKLVYDTLLKTKVNTSIVDDIISRSFLESDQIQELNSVGDLARVSTDIISSRTKNKIYGAMDAIENGVGQNLHRGSALWLYQGINCYLNNTVVYKDAEDKFNGLIDGTSAKLDTQVLEMCISL